MKHRFIAALLAALLLLAGVCTALGAAGDREDPLVTKNYVDGTFVQSVILDARRAFDFTLQQAVQQGSAVGTEAKSTGGFTVKNVSAGSSAVIGLGDSVTLLSGAATVEIQSGALVNVTTGGAASSGKLNIRHRYLGCEDLRAVVVFSEASSVAVDGGVVFTGSVSIFTDVTANDWFYDDVVTAVAKGLVNGKTETTYEPQGQLMLSEAVKLAACLHQLYHQGGVSLVPSTEGMWYQSYVDYAVRCGILTAATLNFDVPATRQQFVEIFYRAMPESNYGLINSIPDGAIPDVTGTESYAAMVYTFYRAGILAGYSSTENYAEHAFGAESNITRGEVAAILTRMYDASARRSFTIG